MGTTGMKTLSRLAVLSATVVLVAGCGAAPSTQAVGQAGAAERARPYIGKPRPPVSVSLAPGATLESGVPGQLSLQVRAGAPLEAVRLTVEGDEGLLLVGLREAPAASAGGEVPGTSGAWHQAASFEVEATPTSGGTRYVSGLLSFRINGVEQAVPFRLPVQVGGPVTVEPVSAKPERLPTRDATGELVDSMPAETTVR
jgi:hypothetical protein